MKSSLYLFMGVLVCSLLAGTGWSQDGQPSTSGPVLAHEPVAVAVSDEPLNLLTRVAAVGAPIRTVTLNYSLSKDGSPVSVEMAATTDGVYMGTIPNDHFRSAQEIWYYIEAVDQSDEWAETSWHQILIKHPGTPEPPPFVPPAAVSTPSQPTPRPATTREPVQFEEDGGIGTPAVVAGGAVLIGAGVVAAIAASGGSSGSGATPTDDTSMMGDGDMSNLDGPTESVGLQCEVADVAGTWIGSDPLTPGFTLFSDQSASFSFLDGETDSGSWTLISDNCFISLSPSGTNTLYQGTGDVRTEGIPFTVSINGRTFTKSN